MFGSAFPPLPSTGVHPECVYDLYPIGRLNRPHEPTKHLLNRNSRESDTQTTADEAEAFVSSRLLIFQQAGRRVDRGLQSISHRQLFNPPTCSRWSFSYSSSLTLMPPRRTICAGTPTTTQSSGTLFSTTAFAPIVTRWPIRIGPRTFAPA